jgi:hypothetical protein
MSAAKTNVEMGAGRASKGALAYCTGRVARVTAVLLVVMAGYTIGRAQSGVGSPTPPQPQSPTMRGGGFGRSMGIPDNETDIDPVMMERRIRALNIERQKQMVSDTNKLLKLAKELNDEVATLNTGSFTPDQLRKIAEIEKLAHNVKDKMTAGAVNTPTMAPPPTLMYPIQ